IFVIFEGVALGLVIIWNLEHRKEHSPPSFEARAKTMAVEGSLNWLQHLEPLLIPDAFSLVRRATIHCDADRMPIRAPLKDSSSAGLADTPCTRIRELHK